MFLQNLIYKNLIKQKKIVIFDGPSDTALSVYNIYV